MTSNRTRITRVLEQSTSFLVASHEHPDGDAIGSTAAMGHLLKGLRKDVVLYNATGLPDRFAWLEMPGPVRTRIPEDGYDWVITLDCGDFDRLGHDFVTRAPRDKLINIDHHQGNPGFGFLNWIDPERSSVGEMVALLARDLGVPLRGPMAEAVYLALVTDTGSFSFGNTSGETLELAAEIVRQGLDPGLFNALMLSQWTLNKVHLQGLALSGARLHLDGKVALVSVSRDMLRKTGSTTEDCEGLVNTMRQIKGVLVGVSLREDPEGNTKFSLRSWGDVDVRSIAVLFGGGGHRNASGGRVPAGLEEAEQKLVSAIGATLGVA